MSKEFEDWLESSDCRLRLVLIGADRLDKLVKLKAPRRIILTEMEMLQKRLDQAIVCVELDEGWKPGESAVPE